MAERPRRRRWRIALAAAAILIGGAAFTLHLLLEPERVTALLVERAHAVGLELRLDGTAHYRYSPRIVAVLPALSLRTATGAELLRAQALQVALPWRSLWTGPLTLDELSLEQPVLDLAALRAWLAARPANGTPAPDLRLHLHVHAGRIVDGAQAVAGGVDAELRNSADLAAWLAQWSPDTPVAQWLPPASATLHAESLEHGAVRIEGLHVEFDDGAPPARER